MKFGKHEDHTNHLIFSGIKENYYYHGDDSSYRGCKCGLEGNCVNNAHKCNCDADEDEIRLDEGYIEKLSDIPIKYFTAGMLGE